MPSGPVTAASTAGAAGSMVMTTLDASATAFGDSAATAPAATSAFTACGLRSNTVSVCPAFITLRAIGAPMVPRPMKPTAVINDAFPIQSSPGRAAGAPDKLAPDHDGAFHSLIRHDGGPRRSLALASVKPDSAGTLPLAS